MNKTADNIILFIAQGFGSGRSPFAPGTFGTLAGVILFLLLKGLPPVAYLVACLLVAGIGTWAAEEAERLLGRKDAQSIVIDEIVGFLIAMFLLPADWTYIIAGFVLFRTFDILKPFPLKRLQDVRGGAGVMLDDIGAGVYANVVLQVAAHIMKP